MSAGTSTVSTVSVTVSVACQVLNLCAHSGKTCILEGKTLITLIFYTPKFGV
jgi:hypothetical protein